MKDLDVRGMACPLPVVSVKRALEEGEGALRVLLDDGTPRENVRRFAEGRGLQVLEEPAEGGYALTLSGGGAPASAGAAGPAGPVVMLFSSDRLGDGPEELGRLLMKNFIMTLTELSEPPDRMLFINTGVHLTTDGSEVLEALGALANRGAEILSCGICLDFFHKKDKLAAGQVTNLFTAAESMLKAGSFIRV